VCTGTRLRRGRSRARTRPRWAPTRRCRPPCARATPRCCRWARRPLSAAPPSLIVSLSPSLMRFTSLRGQMLRCLALCNTVATVAPDAGGAAAAAGVAYEAASPDEEALVRPLPSPPSLILPSDVSTALHPTACPEIAYFGPLDPLRFGCMGFRSCSSRSSSALQVRAAADAGVALRRRTLESVTVDVAGKQETFAVRPPAPRAPTTLSLTRPALCVGRWRLAFDQRTAFDQRWGRGRFCASWSSPQTASACPSSSART